MALVHGSEMRTDPLSPERRSLHSIAVRHPEASHRVENTARELHLHALALEGSTPHGAADDGLVPVDRILHHGPFAVAGSFVPLASTEFSDQADVTIPLPQCPRRSWIQLGVSTRWNEHPDGSSFAPLLSRLVDLCERRRVRCFDSSGRSLRSRAGDASQVWPPGGREARH